MVVCTLPQLIAACHVLHRLLMPRHPPCALNIFIITMIYLEFKLLNNNCSFIIRDRDANYIYLFFKRIE